MNSTIHPPLKHIIENDIPGIEIIYELSIVTLISLDHGGNGHLPFARLRLKPVNRMSCVLEFDAANQPTVGEMILSNKLNSRAGLAISNNNGVANGGNVSGKCVRSNNKLSSLCYLCLEPASVQVCIKCQEAYHLCLHKMSRCKNSLLSLIEER